MSKIEIVYPGDLRTKSTHLESEESIFTDAPKDNQGRGEAFSPTDLFASSLGSCMLTIMGITAKTHGLNIDGSRASINKVMGANPRRVAGIDVQLYIKGKLTDKDKKILIRAAEHCPVSKSIHPDIGEKVTFNFLD